MFLKTEKNCDLGYKYRYFTGSFINTSRQKFSSKFYQKDKPMFHLNEPNEDIHDEEIED